MKSCFLPAHKACSFLRSQLSSAEHRAAPGNSCSTYSWILQTLAPILRSPLDFLVPNPHTPLCLLHACLTSRACQLPSWNFPALLPPACTWPAWMRSAELQDWSPPHWGWDGRKLERERSQELIIFAFCRSTGQLRLGGT